MCQKPLWDTKTILDLLWAMTMTYCLKGKKNKTGQKGVLVYLLFVERAWRKLNSKALSIQARTELKSPAPQ